MSPARKLHLSMRNLGSCLRDAGALCAAYAGGYQAARDTYWDGRCWRPGCGLSLLAETDYP